MADEPLARRCVVAAVRALDNATEVSLTSDELLRLPPFLHLRPGDFLEIVAGKELVSVVKLLSDDDKTSGRIRVFPPYVEHELIHIPPHTLEVAFRERLSERDWLQAKRLEQFHYRGKGFNRIPGRRTALVLEAKGYGVIGYGVLSSTLSSAKPRFDLFETTFGEQMRTRLINRLVRISRIVVHPEFRGLGLGVLMARHLVGYAQERWEINGYRPILVEVIASMTEYHRFFQTAGFIAVGRTEGRDSTVKPTYGTGSFGARPNTEHYTFFADGRPKPYLAYPLSSDVSARLAKRGFKPRSNRRLMKSEPTLRQPIRMRNVSVRYHASNHLSARAQEVKDAFAVDSGQLSSSVLRNLALTIDPGDMVLISGASGSGKSSVLRILTGTLQDSHSSASVEGLVEGLTPVQVSQLDANWDSDRSLVDLVGRNTDDAITLLNTVGLSEAHLYVKRPSQISEGQRYRFAIARLCDSGSPVWVADEFATALDPMTSAVAAKGLRKLAFKRGATVILAAPHIGNFVESLHPNKIVYLSWGSTATIYSARLRISPLGGGRLRVNLHNTGNEPITAARLFLYLDNGRLNELASTALLAPRSRTDPIIIKEEELVGAVAIAAMSASGVGDIRYVSLDGA